MLTWGINPSMSPSMYDNVWDSLTMIPRSRCDVSWDELLSGVGILSEPSTIFPSTTLQGVLVNSVRLSKFSTSASVSSGVD